MSSNLLRKSSLSDCTGYSSFLQCREAIWDCTWVEVKRVVGAAFQGDRPYQGWGKHTRDLLVRVGFFERGGTLGLGTLVTGCVFFFCEVCHCLLSQERCL